jgi:hemolysin III
MPILVIDASRKNRPFAFLGVVVFGITLAMVYLSSTIYHALPAGRAKRLFHALGPFGNLSVDCRNIYTLHPGVLRGGWGWSPFDNRLVHCALRNRIETDRPCPSHGLYVSLYVTMGWLAIIALGPILERVPIAGVVVIFAGGFAYTFGLIFFAADRLRYNHFVWHLFVLRR